MKNQVIFRKKIPDFDVKNNFTHNWRYYHNFNFRACLFRFFFLWFLKLKSQFLHYLIDILYTLKENQTKKDIFFLHNFYINSAFSKYLDKTRFLAFFWLKSQFLWFIRKFQFLCVKTEIFIPDEHGAQSVLLSFEILPAGHTIHIVDLYAYVPA